MKKRSWVQSLLRWVGIIIGVVALFALGFFASQKGWLDPILGGSSATTATGTARGARFQQGATAQTGTGATAGGTVPVRSAATAVGVVSAAGNLALSNEQQVVVQVSGVVSKLPVKVGDAVKQGDLLVVLDSQDAERAVQSALLTMAAAQNDYNNQVNGADPAQIASAQAALHSAQENLAKVMAGPSPQEVASAQASLTAAQAAYDDLKQGPTGAQLTQLQTAMRKAQVAVDTAQTAYDKIAWQNSAGMTSQAADLQSATLDYENAKAAYEEATAPASTSDLQNALSTIQTAQQQVDTLAGQPAAADVADAQAQVASAESSLKQLQGGGDASALETARGSLEQAKLGLNNAVADLASTEIRAPITGTVLSLDLTSGQQVGAGTSVATLADTSDLKLTVNVAEVDIEQVALGQPAEIALDALPGKAFAGVVSQMAPASDPASTVVNYPVTIQLTDTDLSGVRAGMTAVATLRNQATASGWLVPRNAVKSTNGQADVAVVRGGQTITVPVTTGTIQGEWVVVESPDIKEGDQVVGSVTTLVNANQALPFGPGGGGAGRGGFGGAGRAGGGAARP